MSIRRDGGMIVFVCDTCEVELETGTDDFKDANAIRKREQWAIEQVGKDWLHGCPRCGT